MHLKKSCGKRKWESVFRSCADMPGSLECCICGRLLGDVRVEDHHLIPKTFKGKDVVPLHKMCHQKIHATFTERELLTYYHTPERLCEHSEIAKFINWVRKKPSSYYDKNDDTKARKRKR